MKLHHVLEENKREQLITVAPFSYLHYFSVSLILVCTSPVLILLLSEKRNKSPSIILSDIRNSFWARLMRA